MEALSFIFDGNSLTEKYLYHYTDVNGLIGIISNNQVWATSYHFMNDSSEHSYGHQLVKEVIVELLNESEDPILRQIYRGRFEHKLLAESFHRYYYLFSL